MKPRIPTSRKTEATRVAIVWTGVRSLNVTSGIVAGGATSGSAAALCMGVPGRRSAETSSIRSAARIGSAREDDHAVRIGDEPRAGREGDPAERDRHPGLARPGLSARARVRAEGLHTQPELVERDGVSNAAVHDDPGPPAVARECGDGVAEERTAHRAAAVDHEHATLTRLRRLLPDEDVVLVAPHRHDRPLERCGAEAV